MTDPERIQEEASLAVDKFLRHRSSVFLEAALGQYLFVFGRDETLARLIADAEHILDNT